MCPIASACPNEIAGQYHCHPLIADNSFFSFFKKRKKKWSRPQKFFFYLRAVMVSLKCNRKGTPVRR